MNLPDFLHDADGEIRIVGRRIGLFDVLSRRDDGYSAQRIAEEYELSPGLVSDILAFADSIESADEVGAYMNEYRTDLARLEAENPSTEAVLRIRRLMAARKAARSANTP
jgi:uncharacterized protein (DUF433 family)